MELTVFGARGSIPVFGPAYDIYGHDTSCYCIKDGDSALIIDCGSGLIGAAEILSECKKIDVLLSHVHYDHCMGLFETAAFFESRNTDFYGTFDAWEKEGRTEAENRKRRGLKALLLQKNGKKDVNANANANTNANTNPVSSGLAENNAGFYPLIDLKKYLKGNVHNIHHAEKIKTKTGFTVSFRESVHHNETSMIDIEKDGKRVCFTADYEHKENSGITSWAKNCDLLLFDGSYSEEDYVRFMGWGHSKFEDGCKIAKDAGAKRLLLTHFAPLYNDEMLTDNEKKAKELFENAEFAKQNHSYVI